MKNGTAKMGITRIVENCTGYKVSEDRKKKNVDKTIL